MPSRDPQRSAEEGLSSDLFGFIVPQPGEGPPSSAPNFRTAPSLQDKLFGFSRLLPL